MKKVFFFAVFLSATGLAFAQYHQSTVVGGFEKSDSMESFQPSFSLEAKGIQDHIGYFTQYDNFEKLFTVSAGYARKYLFFGPCSNTMVDVGYKENKQLFFGGLLFFKPEYSHLDLDLKISYTKHFGENLSRKEKYIFNFEVDVSKMLNTFLTVGGGFNYLRIENLSPIGKYIYSYGPLNSYTRIVMEPQIRAMYNIKYLAIGPFCGWKIITYKLNDPQFVFEETTPVFGLRVTYVLNNK